MKPIHINPKLRSNCWRPAGHVWFQKNDDSKGIKNMIINMEKKEKEERGWRYGDKTMTGDAGNVDLD